MTEVWITLLNAAVRYYFSQDPETVKRLAQLEGKVIHIILSTGIQLYLKPAPDGLHISADCHATPDVVIQGSPYALWQAQQAQTLAAALGKLQVTGDMECAQQFAQIVRACDIDWEEWLSHRIGDPMACCVHEGMGKMRQWLKRTASSLHHTLTDYLQEEIRVAPSAAELEQFYQDIYQLNNDVERLEARYTHYVGLT